MPRAWVSELGVPQSVAEIYLVKRKTMPTSPTNGRAYLSLVLGDRTGELDARVWDNVERLAERFEEAVAEYERALKANPDHVPIITHIEVKDAERDSPSGSRRTTS